MKQILKFTFAVQGDGVTDFGLYANSLKPLISFPMAALR